VNWETFLTNHNIEFVEYGPNVKQGNINVKCPWCYDDPSHHMGISLSKDAFGCWRNVEHKGTNVARLVRALLGCSKEQARLTVRQYSMSDPSTLGDALASLTGADSSTQPASPGIQHSVKLHKHFRPINKTGTTAKFWRYIRLRGFKDVKHFTDCYSIKCCMLGRWKDRVILPVFHERKLVTWTSRILGNPINAPRYMTHSRDDGATMSIKDTLYNYDDLRDNPKRILFLTEGPFDSLLLDWHGYAHNARATCFFGTQMTLTQAALVIDLTKYYEKVILLLDKNTIEQTFHILDILSKYGVTSTIFEGADDPGDMTYKQIKELVELHL